MSKTESQETTEENDSQTLVPIRVTGRNEVLIGDYKQSLLNQRGRTGAVLWTTVDSLVDSTALSPQEKILIRRYFDIEKNFANLQEEANSELGRSKIQIILEEGKRAYQEMDMTPKMEDPYLYAYVHQISIVEALDHFDKKVTPMIMTDQGLKTITGSRYNDIPQVLEFTCRLNGKEYSMNLKTFVPDEEWIEAYVSKRYTHSQRRDPREQEVFEKFESMLDETTDDTEEIIVNADDTKVTIHRIDEKIEAIVEDEPDLYKAFCGYKVDTDTSIVLDVDMSRADPELLCGVCYGK